MPVFVRNHPHSVHPPERQADGSTLLRRTSGQNALKFASFCGAPAQGWYTGKLQVSPGRPGDQDCCWPQAKPLVPVEAGFYTWAPTANSITVLVAGCGDSRKSWASYPLENVSGHRKRVIVGLKHDKSSSKGACGSVAPAVLLRSFWPCVCVCRREQRAKDWIRFVLAVGQSRNGQQTEGIKGVVCPFSSGA